MSLPHLLLVDDSEAVLAFQKAALSRHYAISTAMNGRPFISYKHKRTFKLGTECTSKSSRNCVTLGQPPTTTTSTPLCDGYLWFGRPWIDNAFRRSYDDLLTVIRTSPFF